MFLRTSSLRPPPALLTLVIALAIAAPAHAQGQGGAEPDNPVSPALRLQRSAAELAPPPPPQPATAVRSIDGSGNNPAQPSQGQAKQPLRRMMPAAYADGVSALAGADRPSPRLISNVLHQQTVAVSNRARLSDLFWQWGQFLDHDLDLSDGTVPPESTPIAVPTGDPEFDPASEGGKTIAFNRSRYLAGSGSAPGNPREQLNEVSAWLDASMVYGSSAERAMALRRLDGSGGLRSSEGDLLPLSLDGSDGDEPRYQFVAGDVRVNEQVGLIALHTLFLREHNRQAGRFRQRHPDWSDEQLYQAARAMVAAQIQAISYREFLPLLLGRDAIPAYAGYRPTAQATIANEFAAAAYRLGHTLVSPILLRIGSDGQEIAAGHLSLFDAFFAPSKVRDDGGIDPILRGMSRQVCQELDVQVIDELRNFLFGLPGAGGFDLASLNIQRGRDHGLPSYNSVRAALGLPPARRMADISRDPETQRRLSLAYGSADRIDLWSGLLAEDHRPGAQVGESLYRILRPQFLALRDGDRFWWEAALPPELREEIRSTRLIDIIRRNTGIGAEMGDSPWRVQP